MESVPVGCQNVAGRNEARGRVRQVAGQPQFQAYSSFGVPEGSAKQIVHDEENTGASRPERDDTQDGRETGRGPGGRTVGPSTPEGGG